MIHKETYSIDGIPWNDPDSYWRYRFDFMLDAASAMQGLLELLVEYRQTRKLTQFLLYCCDQLEITIDRKTGKMREYRFGIDLSNRISLQYSNRVEECRVFLDGQRDSFPTYFPEKLDALGKMLTEIWEDTRGLPVWTIIKEDPLALCVSRLS